MMEIEIVKEKSTPLLSRKRITAWAHLEGPTPSRSKICLAVSKQLKVKPELVCIKHIYTRFGQQNAKIIANIYDDRKSMERLESKILIEKHKLPEEPKEEPKQEAPAEPKENEAAEAPAEESKEEAAEAPAEESKEEDPAEEKKE